MGVVIIRMTIIKLLRGFEMGVVSFDVFRKLDGPWVMKASAPCSVYFKSLCGFADFQENVRLLVLEGACMSNLEGLYGEFERVFELPEYFGRNFNALEECLSDLEWLDGSGYIVFIKDADALLCEEQQDVLRGLIELFVTVAQCWAAPIALGEAWDRPGVPFHVVFESLNARKDYESLPDLIV